MKLVTALAKKFYVEESSEVVEGETGERETVSSIIVFEEEDDAEHMVRFSTTDNVNYTVNNIFSNLTHGTVLTEKEIKVLLKNNSIKPKE